MNRLFLFFSFVSAGDVLDHEKLQLVELPVGFEPTIRDHPHCAIHHDEGQVGVGSVKHVKVVLKK